MAGPCVTTMEIEEGAQQKDFDVTMTQGIAAVSYAGMDTIILSSTSPKGPYLTAHAIVSWR